MNNFTNCLITVYAICLLSSCASDNTQTTDVATNTVAPAPIDPGFAPNLGGGAANTNMAPAPNPAAAVGAAPSTNLVAGKERGSHFTCPKYCTGSGAETNGICPVCKSAYVHNENSDGHRAELARVAAANDPSILRMQFKDTVYSMPKGNEYEKKAHYICEKSCKGSGNEFMGNCSVCNAAYKHNDNSYHHEAMNKYGFKEGQ
ncbi:MAG: hypothetical protein IPO27_05035 [Bacteroidetes bacterium]|nr:hypothetical protein [Bacteroidota bacterium]